MVITIPAMKICWKISHTLKTWYIVSAKSITILMSRKVKKVKMKVKKTNQQKESKLKYLKTGVGINWNNH